MRSPQLPKEGNCGPPADMLGVDRSYLSEIETGKKDPSLRILKTIADRFKLSLSQLLRGF